MGLLRLPAEQSAVPVARGGVTVEAKGVGVTYSLGTKRDDLKSLVFKTLLQRERRQTVWSLKDVDFTATSGDIVGIIGPNGAGKTTLCKVIAGLLRPDEGHIQVEGRVFSLLALGTGFHPEQSGRENAIVNAMTLGWSREEAVSFLPDIIAFAELEQFIDQPLKTYSAGMKARLAFAVAAMAQADILIIDEALSVGDVHFNAKAAAKMQELVGQARLVLVVTHSMDFVQKYCTRAVWIEKGRIRAVGSPKDMVRQYKESIPQVKPQVVRSIEFRQTEERSTSVPVVVAEGVGLNFPMHNRSGSVQQQEFWPLKDVSFTVNQGDILGIIGRNGAGKTTLCRMLSGILRPDRGRLQVNGETTALLTLGTGFNHQLTGRDNVFLNGMMLGLPKKRLIDLYDDIAAFSGIGDFINRPVKQYSRGMVSRLGFSVAAIIQPDIFLIDEALAVGDLAFYEKASTKMQELMDQAKAVIVVTHDMSFVHKVCTRAIWLENGTVTADGPAKDVAAEYQASSKK